jgi:membrane associated rhomboid family serine protease
MQTATVDARTRWTILTLLALFAGVHAALWLIAPRLAAWWFAALALVPYRLLVEAAGMAGGEAARVTSLVTHMIVHADLPHLALNSMALLSLGPEVAQRLGPLRFLAFFVITGLGGAALYIALNAESVAPMIGASGAISGIFGGLLRIPARGAHLPLQDAVRRRQVLAGIAAFLVIDAIVVTAAGGWTGGSIAWEAHLGGLITGFLLFDLFDPLARKVGG